MIKCCAIFLMLLIFNGLKAQQAFVPYGKITFEKRINIQRSMAELDIPDEAKAKVEKYSITAWELLFNETSSLYRSQKVEDYQSKSQIYTDFKHNNRVIKRTIFDETYLLPDTIVCTDWKITHDIRTIAGYDCRKAIARINDTVYVVAFYTDEILLRVGPEGFTRLPGMILGLAIPRYNTTWFATKVESFVNLSTEIIAPTKGKRLQTEKEKTKLIEVVTRFFPDKKEKAAEAKRYLYGFTL